MSDDPKEEAIELQGPSGNGSPEIVSPKAAMRLDDTFRITRLSVKVITGIGLVAGIGIGTALIFALQPKKHNNENPELYSGEATAKADGLSDLPKDYTDNYAGVPKLGVPLPGDFGRTYLNASRYGTFITPFQETGETSQTRLTEEEQRRLQESEAARLAQLFVPNSSRANPAGTGAQLPTLNADISSFADSSRDPAIQAASPTPQASTPQERQQSFLNQPSNPQTVAETRISHPPSPFILQAGSIIPAALITGIRSDLPGQITAQVTENVHDSPTGRILLIPQGARIIGQYDNNVSFGQSRILLVWNRLIFPDGRSINLDRQPGADNQGQAGLEDQVDYHWGQMFRAAALSTLLAVGAEAGNTDADSDIVRALRQGASDSISDIGQQIVQRQLNIAPTLTIRPGFPVRVIITRDLILEPAT